MKQSFLGPVLLLLSFAIPGCGLGGVDSMGDDDSTSDPDASGGAGGTSSTVTISNGGSTLATSGGSASEGGSSARTTTAATGGSAAITTEPVPVPGSEFTIVGSQLAFVNDPSLNAISARTSQVTVSVESVPHTFAWSSAEPSALMTYMSCGGGLPHLDLGSCADDGTTECLEIHLSGTGLLTGQYVTLAGVHHQVTGTLRGVFGPVEGKTYPASGVLFAAIDLFSVDSTIRIEGQLILTVPIVSTLC